MNEMLTKMGERAKKAARELSVLGTAPKNAALLKIRDHLLQKTGEILAENKKDVEKAKADGLTSALIDRLLLTEERIADVANGVYKVSELPDPIGEVTSAVKRPNGLLIAAQRVPLGVIAIIYESRPNVTVDAAVLCLKSGNPVILRGGKEAFYSNVKLAYLMREALSSAGVTPDAVQIVEDISRNMASDLMRLNGYIDVLIPRGGAGLIQSVVKNATVPVIETGAGNCHIYVDDPCDLKMAAEITFNAKTTRVSVCNSAESLLICRSIAKEALPPIKARLDEKSVQLYGCPETQKILPGIFPATEEDYYAEYNDYKMSVKIVSDVGEAIDHINHYSTGHSDAIVTKSYENAKRFLSGVDSAAVYVNASTRFTDGFEFGLGAEIGISTQKMHARGPMGLKELTSVKYIVMGDGQVRI